MLQRGIGGVLIVVLRTFSSILLHLVASSFTGYGIAKYQVEGESFGVVVKYYFLAVLVHAAWNAAAVVVWCMIVTLVPFCFLPLVFFWQCQVLSWQRGELENWMLQVQIFMEIVLGQVMMVNGQQAA